MARTVKLVYQDCPMCGARKEWGLKQSYLAGANNIVIEPTPFYSNSAKGLSMKAIKAGIGKLPFFTDGEKFAYSIAAFIETPEIESDEAEKEPPKKTVKKKRELKNGTKTKTS